MIKNIDLFEKMSVPKAVAKLATPTVLRGPLKKSMKHQEV